MGVKSINIKLIATSDDFTKSINCSHFQSVDPLLPPYTNITTLPPNATNRGYAGIVTENDMIILRKNPSGNISQFEKLSNGIVATNSIMNISYTSFTDMQPETEYNWLGDQGVGVKSSGDFGTSKYTSLNLKGLGVESGDPVTFNNCLTGITTEISALTVSNAKFSNLFNGIVSRYPYSQPIVIHDNVISAEETGIGLYTTDLGGYIDVRDNTITIDETGSSGNPTFGIGMFNAMFPFNWSVCRINCNDITLDNASTGIWISGVTSSLASRTLGVNDNSIHINDNSATLNGVLFQDVTGAFLQHNAVTGSDPSETTSTNAFHFFNSTSNVISQNSSDGTKVGFQFDMDCTSKDNIRGNNMGDHFHGMELKAGSFTGQQEYTGNSWGGYAGSPPYPYEEDPSDPGKFIGAWADPSMTFQDLSQSQFTVNSSSTLVYFPYYTPVNTGWFFGDVGSNQTFSYSDNCLVIPPLSPDLRLGYVDSLIVSNTITSPVYQEELRINSALHLRDKLVLIKQNEDIPSFFANYLSDYSSTAAGKIARYRDTLSMLSNIGSDSIDFIHLNDSMLHSRLADISLLDVEDNNGVDTLLEQAHSFFYSLNLVRIHSVEQLLSNITTIVYDLMDGITTSHVIESNLKDSYLSFFDLMMEEDTSELKSILHPIANQCIYEGGPGVTIARNLLATLDSCVIYDDNMLCGSSRIGQISNSDSENSYKNITVFPNPSTGLFTVVVLREPSVQKRVFSVYDLSGSLMYTLENIGDAGQIALDLSGFAPGMYYLKVQINSTNYYQKLSVVR